MICGSAGCYRIQLNALPEAASRGSQKCRFDSRFDFGPNFSLTLNEQSVYLGHKKGCEMRGRASSIDIRGATEVVDYS